MVPRPTLTGGRDRKLLLVLSHMRSYSTLLTHILDDHPAIHGWHELHRSYETAEDVDRTIAKQLGRRSERYACDNVLHNEYPVADAVLASDRVDWIISVRNARSTLRSLWRWGGRQNKYRKAGVAADYYIDRVRELERMGSLLDGRFVLLRSDLLVDEPDETVAALTDAFELDPPLRPEYTPDDRTGSPNHGDFSQYIKTGKIVQERSYKLTARIPRGDIERCGEVRAEMLQTLRRRARCVV